MAERDKIFPGSGMESLTDQISSCNACSLSISRTRTVPGEGPVPCRIMLVGEGPGKKEDESGRPFVGRAGAILSGLLSDIGLSRHDVFITSVVKCRPPGNRTPKSDEIASCIPFLNRQVVILSPRVLVPMGSVAAAAVHGMFGLPFPSFKEVRGRVVCVQREEGRGEMLVIPVYHPAVITHNPPARSTLEEDFRQLGKCLQDLKNCDGIE